MPVLSGNLVSIIGEPLTNPIASVIPQADATVSGTDVRLGAEPLTLDADGAFSITLPAGAYKVRVEFTEARRARKTWESLYFLLSADADLADKVDDEPYAPEVASLSIGTVTTGAPGSSADVTLTGGVLDFTIPAGDDGVGGDLRSFVAGRYYRPFFQTYSTSWAGLSLGGASLIPMIVWRTGTIDRIGINVQSAAAGGSFRLGIYADASGIPGSLLVDAGTVDASTTGPKELTVSVSVTRGDVIWLAAAVQGSSAVAQADTTSGVPNPDVQIGSATLANISQSNYPAYGLGTVLGALPSTSGITASSTQQIRGFIPFIRMT